MNTNWLKAEENKSFRFFPKYAANFFIIIVNKYEIFIFERFNSKQLVMYMYLFLIVICPIFLFLANLHLL